MEECSIELCRYSHYCRLHFWHHLVWNLQGQTTNLRRVFFSWSEHDLAHRRDFLFAANIGSNTLIGLTSDAFQTNTAVYNYEWMAAVVLVFFSIFFLPFYLRSKVLHHAGVS